MSEIHRRLSAREIPIDADGRVLVDLYVLMPASHRYIRFVCKGDVFDDERRKQLKRHILPDVYALPSELNEASNADYNVNRIVYPDTFQSEVLGIEAEGDLKKIYEGLLDLSNGDTKEVLVNLQSSSDKILSIVAPESKDLTEIFFSNLKYVNLMNEASAITSLAVMFAFANGFDSRKSYTELTQAALVMDVSLSKLSDDERRLMYVSPDELGEETRRIIEEHPTNSHKLVLEKLPNLSEVAMQLVLNHHELFNGKGFPRGVRTESLFPLVKILSLAVDTHFRLKQAEYNEETKDIGDIVLELHEEDVEAHLRRHNRKLTATILSFFDKAAAGNAAA